MLTLGLTFKHSGASADTWYSGTTYSCRDDSGWLGYYDLLSSIMITVVQLNKAELTTLHSAGRLLATRERGFRRCARPLGDQRDDRVSRIRIHGARLANCDRGAHGH